MKKLLALATFFTVIASSMFSAELKDLSEWIWELPVWTEQYGPLPLYEKLNLNKMGLVSLKVSYDASCDNGDWIDAVFAEDPTFVVVKPAELDELSSIGSQEAVLEESVVIRRIKDAEERLTFFQYGEEVISVQEKGLDRIFVFRDKKKTVRKSYDASMNLLKKETWRNTNSSVVTPDIVQTFTYGKGTKPESSVILKADEKHNISYDEKGKIVRSVNYRQFKKDESSNARFYKDSVTSWKYNDEGHILEKITTDFDYNKIYTKVTGTFVKKEEYQYKVSDSVPDYFYYENGELRMSSVYSAEDSYVTTMIFDDGFVIESYYDSGKRKKDIYYLNGVVRRTKNYDM